MAPIKDNLTIGKIRDKTPSLKEAILQKSARKEENGRRFKRIGRFKIRFYR